MKYIEKREEPENFAEWRRKKSEDIIRQSRSGNMDNVFNLLQNQPRPETGIEESDSYTKMQLREDLLHEQGFLCAYCTQRIENSYKTKIDHFQPKENPEYHHWYLPTPICWPVVMVERGILLSLASYIAIPKRAKKIQLNLKD